MKKLWFRAKYYGWGWYPVTIEGWLVIAGFVLVLTGSAFLFSNYMQIHAADPAGSLRYVALAFVAWITLLMVLLIYICYKTGERPRWRWGGKDIAPDTTDQAL
jgi:hypothetical protein